jgi:hypothetical protein
MTKMKKKIVRFVFLLGMGFSPPSQTPLDDESARSTDVVMIEVIYTSGDFKSNSKAYTVFIN